MTRAGKVSRIVSQCYAKRIVKDSRRADARRVEGDEAMQTQGGDTGRDGVDGIWALDQLMEQMAREFGVVLEEALGRIAGGVPAEQASQWAEAEAKRRMAWVRQQWARSAHEERRGKGAGSHASEDEGEGDAEALSAREIEVLMLVAQGLSGQEIADELTITRDTAYRHGENAAAKLGVRGARRAVVEARRRGLIG